VYGFVGVVPESNAKLEAMKLKNFSHVFLHLAGIATLY
jgi:hypothetical protein